MKNSKAPEGHSSKPALYRKPAQEGKVSASGICPVYKKCGGCDLQGVSYPEQLKRKERQIHKLMGSLVKTIRPIVGMEDPKHYRCKVNAAFAPGKRGEILCGTYEKNSHRIVATAGCMIEDKTANSIIECICSLLPSFRIRPYDEDTGRGFLRHVQVRRGYATGQYMVTLVCTDPVFPSKVNFVKALRKQFPQISTVILNVNDKPTSMVIGERNITLYGKGYIEDELCGSRFRISPGSFYQINPPQTQKLYETAIRYAGLTGRETVLDAYCGTGTIGIIASGLAKMVIGVELSPEAVRDAIWNARRNRVNNIRFIKEDAGMYMNELSELCEEESSFGQRPDVVFLDPPRSGTTPEFIEAVYRLSPKRVVYVSCGPDTLARDLALFKKKGYETVEMQCFDLFPYTEHVETVVLMSRVEGE